ncbi:hypothetical protein [Rhizobium sp.]|uniref:hypothetical protein n=1 Tax=Rhizobium sp. TaxID=391 RepID=UPI0028AE1EFD
MHTPIAGIFFIAKAFLTAMNGRILLGAGNGELPARSYLPRYFCFLNVSSRVGAVAVCTNARPHYFGGISASAAIIVATRLGEPLSELQHCEQEIRLRCPDALFWQNGLADKRVMCRYEDKSSLFFN